MDQRNKPAPDGHTFVTNRGYRIVKLNGAWHYEHRLVVQVRLGRRLRHDEIVHHKNGDRLDNDFDNLEVLSPGEHSRHHNQKHPLTLICERCGTEFMPHPSNRGRQRFCSHSCKRIGKLPPVARFTMKEAAIIRQRIIAGERQSDLATEYGASRAAINRIAKNKAYKEQP